MLFCVAFKFEKLIEKLINHCCFFFFLINKMVSIKIFFVSVDIVKFIF